MSEETKQALIICTTIGIIMIGFCALILNDSNNHNQFMLECIKTNSITDCRSN